MNWAEFFSMGGRAFYVWGSFGAFAVAIAIEIILLRGRAQRAQRTKSAAAETKEVSQ